MRSTLHAAPQYRRCIPYQICVQSFEYKKLPVQTEPTLTGCKGGTYVWSNNWKVQALLIAYRRILFPKWQNVGQASTQRQALLNITLVHCLLKTELHEV